jgi:hypothetical protein
MKVIDAEVASVRSREMVTSHADVGLTHISSE